MIALPQQIVDRSRQEMEREPCRIGELMPSVLRRYGIDSDSPASSRFTAQYLAAQVVRRQITL